MDNSAYGEILGQIATLRQIRGDNPFKSRAFESAARVIKKHPDSIDELLDAGENLTKIDGIGKSIAAELKLIYETGESLKLNELKAEFPPGIFDLTRVEGLGPKRIKILHDELGVGDLATLEAVAKDGRIAELPGMGKKLEDKVLAEIARLSAGAQDRIPLPAARVAAESIVEQLSELDAIQKIEIAGSIRRGRETIGDIDILVTVKDQSEHEIVFDTFVALREIGEVLVRGDTKTSARLRSGTQVDVRVVEPHQFGAALHYFTGSKDHNIQIRSRAKDRGMRVNEYGVLRVEDETYIGGETEEELFGLLDLVWIPPELRQGDHEIAQAEKDELPKIVSSEDVLGDLHMHTTESDGRNSIAEMVETAKTLGYQYIAITDHSALVPVTNGMDAERFRAHIDRMKSASENYDDFDVLAGIEVDILRDGALDMDHDLLKEADWVVGSIHMTYKHERDEMTSRLIAAIETGLLDSIGHPTGRILGGRKGYEYDFKAVVAACVEHNVALEINGSTGRLDLNAEMAAKAVALGAKIVLGSDAHSTRGLQEMRYAIQQARRGRIDRSMILNTRPAAELRS